MRGHGWRCGAAKRDRNLSRIARFATVGRTDNWGHRAKPVAAEILQVGRAGGRQYTAELPIDDSAVPVAADVVVVEGAGSNSDRGFE